MYTYNDDMKAMRSCTHEIHTRAREWDQEKKKATHTSLDIEIASFYAIRLGEDRMNMYFINEMNEIVIHRVTCALRIINHFECGARIVLLTVRIIS